MAAGAREGDFEAPAAQGAVGNVVGVGAIHHHHGFDLARQRLLLAEVAHTQQVAFALLTYVGHQQQVAGEFGKLAGALPDARHGQQGGKTGAVVGDARPAEAAVVVDRNIILIARRDHGIEVGAEDHVGSVALGGDDVAGAVDGGGPFQSLELLLEPGGALLFEKSGRRDAAELQVGLVDPLFFAGEPLEAFANAAVVSQFPDIEPRCRVRRHAVHPV